MSVKTGAGAESFVAFWADVRLLSCVSSDVSLQQTGSIKCFSTNIARKHCLGFWSPSWTCSWNSLLRKGKQRRCLWLQEECWWCGYWWWHHERKCCLTNKWNYSRSFQQWCDWKIVLWIFLFSKAKWRFCTCSGLALVVSGELDPLKSRGNIAKKYQNIPSYEI